MVNSYHSERLLSCAKLISDPKLQLTYLMEKIPYPIIKVVKSLSWMYDEQLIESGCDPQTIRTLYNKLRPKLITPRNGRLGSYFVDMVEVPSEWSVIYESRYLRIHCEHTEDGIEKMVVSGITERKRSLEYGDSIDLDPKYGDQPITLTEFLVLYPATIELIAAEYSYEALIGVLEDDAK